jgi:hypothetical protein
VPAADTPRPNTPKPRLKPPAPDERLRNQFTWQISLIRLGDSVRDGVKCTWEQQGGTSIEGYLAGLDSEYFLVFEPYTVGGPDKVRHAFHEHLVSRAMNVRVTIHPENTFEDEVAHPQMCPRVDSFREWVEASIPKAPALPVAQPPKTGNVHPRPVPRAPRPHPGAATPGPYGPLVTPQFTAKKG